MNSRSPPFTLTGLQKGSSVVSITAPPAFFLFLFLVPVHFTWYCFLRDFCLETSSKVVNSSNVRVRVTVCEDRKWKLSPGHMTRLWFSYVEWRWQEVESDTKHTHTQWCSDVCSTPWSHSRHTTIFILVNFLHNKLKLTLKSTSDLTSLFFYLFWTLVFLKTTVENNSV